MISTWDALIAPTTFLIITAHNWLPWILEQVRREWVRTK